MPRYRKVEPKVWNDTRFRRLSPMLPSGQGLWLYLLTTPHSTSIPGLFVASVGGMADDLRWEPKAFRQAFREVSREGLAEYDEVHRVVYIPKAISHNPPESPNVVISWAKHWDEIPDCDLKTQAYRTISKYLEGMAKGYREAFLKAFREPLPEPSLNQEQDQDQDQDQEQDLIRSRQVEEICRAEARPLCDAQKSPEETVPANQPITSQTEESEPAKDKWSAMVQEVVAHYKQFHPKAKPGRKERVRIEARLREEKWTVLELKRAIDGIHTVPHNMGDNDRHQTYLDLDLIFRDSAHVQKYIRAMDVHEKVADNGIVPVVSQLEKNNIQVLKNFLARHKEENDSASTDDSFEGEGNARE